MIIKPLPSWAIINRFPAFYEGESLTAIEQTARVYAKMQELVDSYNKYIEQVNAELMELETQTDKDLNCAVKTIINLTDSYINMVDMKLARMNRTLDENYVAFTDNVAKTITGMVQQMKESGELDEQLLAAVSDLGDRFTNVQEQWNTTIANLQTAFNANMSELVASYQETKDALTADYETAKSNLEDNFHRMEDAVNETAENLAADYETAKQGFREQYDESAGVLTAFKGGFGKPLYSYYDYNNGSGLRSNEMIGMMLANVLKYRSIVVELDRGFKCVCSVVPVDDTVYMINGVGTSAAICEDYSNSDGTARVGLCCVNITVADNYVNSCSVICMSFHTNRETTIDGSLLSGITRIYGLVPEGKESE